MDATQENSVSQLIPFSSPLQMDTTRSQNAPQPSAVERAIPGAVFDLKPKMLLACQNYGREFAKSIAENVSVAAMKEMRVRYDQHKKAGKKTLKKLDHNIGGIEKKMAYVDAANEKQKQHAKDVINHSKRLWDTLNLHVEAVSRGMLQFKDIQVQLSSVLAEDEQLQAEAKKLQGKATGLDAKVQALKAIKEGVLQEKTRLKSLMLTEAEKKKEFQQMSERLEKGQSSLKKARQVLSDRVEKEAKMRGEVAQLKTANEQLHNQINSLVTERNRLELKVEAKEMEEKRQLNMIQAKRDSFQEMCNVRVAELGAKLALQRERARVPLKVS